VINPSIRQLILEAASEIQNQGLVITPKGHHLLKLVREGRSYAEAEKIVDLAYDEEGFPLRTNVA